MSFLPELNKDSPPNCPNCNKLMVKRLARNGANAGNYFWGCSDFPDCRGTLDLSGAPKLSDVDGVDTVPSGQHLPRVFQAGGITPAHRPI